MKEFEIKTLINEYSFAELSQQDQELVAKANESSGRVYAPFPKYNVGAILLDNGRIMEGSNQENSAPILTVQAPNFPNLLIEHFIKSKTSLFSKRFDEPR